MEELLNSYINLDENIAFFNFITNILIKLSNFFEVTLKIPTRYSNILTFIVTGLIIIAIGIAMFWLIYKCFSNDATNKIGKPPKD